MAKDRLQEWIWEKDCIATYLKNRNGMMGSDYSSKFSPWFSTGCISRRYIYEQVKNYEIERVANSSTYWLIFELLWHGYFKFLGLKDGSKLFHPAGLKF